MIVMIIQSYVAHYLHTAKILTVILRYCISVAYKRRVFVFNYHTPHMHVNVDDPSLAFIELWLATLHCTILNSFCYSI